MEDDKKQVSAQSAFYDVRVAVVGNVDAGKSTLTGVLVSGKLDNGRGEARSRVVIHPHEEASGRTSSQSHHILGIKEDNSLFHQTVPASATALQKNKGWATVMSESRNIVTFIDLCGHEMYLHTTVGSMTGCFPDYVFVVVNALAGVKKMTKEHIGVALALGIPICVVVTKMDLVPDNVLERTKLTLFKILKSPAANKLPLHVRKEEDIQIITKNNDGNRICPVFFVSCINGTGIPLLNAFLATLKPRTAWRENFSTKGMEFQIDETYLVSGIGLVLSGMVMSGTLRKDQNTILGPFRDGSWMPISIRSLHIKRVPNEECQSPLSCSVSVRAENLHRSQIRKGMVLLDADEFKREKPLVSRIFEAEVVVLQHPTTIKTNYQAVIHCGQVRQSAQILSIRNRRKLTDSKQKQEEQEEQKEQKNQEETKEQKEQKQEQEEEVHLRIGDKAIVVFRFTRYDEYIHQGMSFVFREGGCKGIGKIIRCQHHFKEEELKTIDQSRKNIIEYRRKSHKSRYSKGKFLSS